ncbi:MAG TPA: VOC family protein [Jatrophihabitans sp.]|jgi:hypothetical protein|nr:VOC family protein [Jatrophihabitans sp.]
MEIRWLSLFADVPADRMDAALEFWTAATGTRTGPPEGEAGEFVPLRPADGDTWLWVQRLGTGRPGWHLDLHVPDPEAAAARAAALGASAVRSGDGLRVLATPAGQQFCLVAEDAGRPRRRAAPPRFGAHRSLADQLSLDLPAGAFETDAGFWAAFTGWPRRGPDGSEFDRLAVPGPLPAQLLLQRLDPDAPEGAHAHLDFSADDRDAEVERHRALGAEPVRRTRQWTTLRDPAGLVYCVTRRRTGERFGMDTGARMGTPSGT